MAERNTVDNKRFVSRLPNKKSEARLVPENRSKSHSSSRELLPSSPRIEPLQRSIDRDTPVRRVIVVRNTNHPQLNKKLADVGDIGQSDSGKIPPVITNGHTSIYLIRRPIASSEPPKPVE